LAPIAVVEYLKAALAFASDHRLSMAIAELYLSNGPPSGVNLAQDDGCAPLCAPGARQGQA